MKKRYYKVLRKLAKLSVSIKGSDYSLSVSLISHQHHILFKIDLKKCDNKAYILSLGDVTFIQAIFFKEKKSPLLIFTIERWASSTMESIDSIQKSKDIDAIYENYLANVSSVKRKPVDPESDDKKSDWWTTINKFINAVQYSVKMKKGLKELGGPQA